MGSEQLSVLLCTDYLPPGGGGVEVVVETLATHLVEYGVDVTIMVPKAADGTTPSLSSINAINLYEIPSVDLTEALGLQCQISPTALLKLRTIIRRHDPDIIHVHNRFFFTSFMIAIWKLFQRDKVPVVTTFHLGPIDDIDGAAGYIARLYERLIGRLLLRTSDAVIAVSDAVAAHARSLDASTVPRVVPNGVDPQEFTPARTGSDDRGKRILFVGRLIQNKGPHVLIEALPEVLSAHPDITVEIVGTGPMADELQARTAELDLDHVVHFRGYVNSVAARMRDADIFCRPSFSEGMPLTLLEAMASGLPAVVTPVAGVPEVVTDGETGILIEQDNPQELARALMNLLDEPSLAATIGEQAREHVLENYGWEQRTEQILDVYHEVIPDQET